MHGPPWVGWLLMLLSAATGGYYLARARPGTAGQRVEARGEGLMGLGMAVMAVPATVVAPPSWSPWLYVAVFGVASLWALAYRHLHLVVGSAAMVYMALTMTGTPAAGPAGHAAHAGGTAPGGVPLLTGLLLGYYSLFIIATGIRLASADSSATTATTSTTVTRATGALSATAVAPSGSGTARRPEVLRASRLAMGIGMFAMLLVL
ncbi:DUF5134 domain-containing protein [Streptomyces halobius]|uniref:DUF5134 domain-containing protein n=1 Tax=Streptomyces halobius TaxID=2879846 RepID=A0ABY4MG82_9ACTN|nr:DUF5134 domain-containing protein [Streptomyces halobius]UQA96675.1 DUF5134 domain-containing protein [Streptomyces halobius]